MKTVTLTSIDLVRIEVRRPTYGLSLRVGSTINVDQPGAKIAFLIHYINTFPHCIVTDGETFWRDVTSIPNVNGSREFYYSCEPYKITPELKLAFQGMIKNFANSLNENGV